MAAVRWVVFEDMRGDCSTSDHADGDNPDSNLRADAAARQECDCAFAHAALPDRGRVDTEAVQLESRSHAELREPAEMTDEHGREQGCRLVAEAAPQPLGVRLVLQSAVCAALKVRKCALGQLL